MKGSRFGDDFLTYSILTDDSTNLYTCPIPIGFVGFFFVKDATIKEEGGRWCRVLNSTESKEHGQK